MSDDLPYPPVATAAACRPGNRQYPTDAYAVHRLPDLGPLGPVALALAAGATVGGDTAMVSVLATEIAARVATRRGVLAGLLAASEVVDYDADVVAACATALPGMVEVAWIGPCRVYAAEADGSGLTNYSQESADVSPDPRLTLSQAVVSALSWVEMSSPLVILTSPGTYEAVTDAELIRLVREFADAPQALADAITAAADEDEAGVRPPASAAVLRAPLP